ncbi:MBL fold metallo-hydrolase [Brevibacillus reuszeri]|uniref:MBL fold metallo-hydrolase n=1 Tax=Brevibacillus reuszeri TaxID=54915 RepID=UPI000673A147|nr:MBL fold metallo-hydrolase [Brevibacillus reuszeri]MED1861527.1 MBL fold metallo-hydrolase [Brevibacillus reuszeri]
MTNALVTGATRFWTTCLLAIKSNGMERRRHAYGFLLAQIRLDESDALLLKLGADRLASSHHAVDVEGTRHVVDGCRKQNVLRLIHISTPSSYFDYRDRGGISESEPLPVKQVIAYAATKLLELRQPGIGEEEVRYVVLSHFHADHPAGLRDFPNARILYKRDAHTAIKDLGLLASVKAGCLPGLLPDDFEERSAFIDETPMRRLPGIFRS